MVATVEQSTELALRDEAQTVVNQATALVIADADGYTAGVEFLKALKATAKKVREFFDPDIQAAHSLHKSLVAKRDTFLRPLDAAEATVNGKALAWKREEDRKRQGAQRAAEAAARKAEEERRLAMAEEAERQGKAALAQQIIDAPIEVAAPVISQTVPKIDGVSFSEGRWDIEIVNMAAIPQDVFVKAALCSKGMRDGLVGALKKMVQDTGGAWEIPGVRAFKTANMSVKA